MKIFISANKKEIKGITLIALVITVVVLVIISSVAIGIIVGQNGIINRTKEASNGYINAQENEKDILNNYDFKLASTRDNQDTSPIGTIIAYMGGTTAPENYLACDGSELNISDYPELATQFETGFGTKNHFGGDGTTTFKVPDLQGEFLRGTGTNSHTNQGNGESIGIHQDGTSEIFLRTDGSRAYIGQAANGIYEPKNYDYMSARNRHLHGYAEGNHGSASYPSYYIARPTNTSVLYCIKAK